MTAEKVLLDAIHLSVRDEAKRRRKFHLKRSTKIGVLLCLKFPDKVIKCRKDKIAENSGESPSADRGSASTVCQSSTSTSASTGMDQWYWMTWADFTNRLKLTHWLIKTIAMSLLTFKGVSQMLSS